MEEQETTIRDLELALQAKINPLKLAETRLENRKMRPHMDLCADVPMEGLIAEVQAIRNTMQMLRDKLDHARYHHNKLLNYLHIYLPNYHLDKYLGRYMLIANYFYDY